MLLYQKCVANPVKAWSFLVAADYFASHYILHQACYTCKFPKNYNRVISRKTVMPVFKMIVTKNFLL